MTNKEIMELVEEYEKYVYSSGGEKRDVDDYHQLTEFACDGVLEDDSTLPISFFQSAFFEINKHLKEPYSNIAIQAYIKLVEAYKKLNGRQR